MYIERVPNRGRVLYHIVALIFRSKNRRIFLAEKMIYFAPDERTRLKRMQREKLLEEQLVRLDARAPWGPCWLGYAEGSHRGQTHDGASYEYAVMHGEDDQAESIRRRMNKLTENV